MNEVFAQFNRFERRKILGVSFLFAAVGAIGALLLSDKAEYDKGKEIETLLLDMF